MSVLDDITEARSNIEGKFARVTGVEIWPVASIPLAVVFGTVSAAKGMLVRRDEHLKTEHKREL